MTSHNRKDLTLKCLESLYRVMPMVDVYLAEDGSTDGTKEAVAAAFPNVNILSGSGNLYWSRGMRMAWLEAMKKDYSYYLWLNDDLVLLEGCLEELLECCKLGGGECIVSGLVEDAVHHRIIYGGYDESKHIIQANGKTQDIVKMNGNVVLVPQQVVKQIGIIDPYYVHDLGDLDYGLTARAHGIRVLSTRCSVAKGYINSPCRVRLWNASIWRRFRKLNSPLGSPLDKNFHFRRKHYGLVHAVAFVSFVIVLNLLPDWLVVKLWGFTYVDRNPQSDL